MIAVMVGHSYAQASEPATSVQVSTVPENPQANTTPGAPQPITFADALQRARAIHPQTQAAFTAAGLAHQDLVQSRAAMLPLSISSMMSAACGNNPRSHVGRHIFEL